MSAGRCAKNSLDFATPAPTHNKQPTSLAVLRPRIRAWLDALSALLQGEGHQRGMAVQPRATAAAHPPPWEGGARLALPGSPAPTAMAKSLHN